MKYLTTLQVANDLKISKQTLLNWLYAKKVPEPPRNRNGYRLWSSARVSLIRKMIGDGRIHRRTVIHREPSKGPEVVAELAREVSQFLRDAEIPLRRFQQELSRIHGRGTPRRSARVAARPAGRRPPRRPRR
jgi:DNA-binding transcriptional MerR regulator